MNISEYYDIHDIVKELEIALQVDGQDMEIPDLNKVISNVKFRIKRQYGIDVVNHKVSDAVFELSSDRNSLTAFIDNIGRIHAKLCGYGQVARYFTACNISLREVNYLGYEEESLKDALIALHSKRYIVLPEASEAIESIKGKLGTISACLEKRLFVLMILAYELGLYEVTSAIAEILYISTIQW